MRSRARAALLTLAVPVLVVSEARPCLACSCPVSSPREYAEHAEVVFTGSVVSVRQLDEPDPLVGEVLPMGIIAATFEVEQVYKGEVANRMVVKSNPDEASCGFFFGVGRRYTVFTYEAEGQTWTDLCSGTTTGGITPARYGLDEQQPAEASTPPSEPELGSSPAGRSVTPARIGWLATFLVAAGGVLFFAVRRGRRV